MSQYTKTVDEIIQAMADGKCFICGEKFSPENVFTEAGWREISISGSCERCFDNLFLEEEEDE